MVYKVENIEWDKDEEEVDLPTELIVEIPNKFFIKMSEEEIEEFVSDKITDITGFCHFGFSLVVL